MARRTDQEKNEALRLVSEGKSVRDISREMDIPIATISKWKRETKVPRPDLRSVSVEPPDNEREIPEPGRVHDFPPTRPTDGKIQPVDLNYRDIENYIEGFYKLAGQLAYQSDQVLGMVVQDHAEKAGKAWANWIRSEPKVAALLQRLMIGTPLGEVIGVHVSIIVGYFFARSAIRAVEQQREFGDDDTDSDAAADSVVSA